MAAWACEAQQKYNEFGKQDKEPLINDPKHNKNEPGRDAQKITNTAKTASGAD